MSRGRGSAGVLAGEFGRRLAARTDSGRDAPRTRRRDACGTLAQPYVGRRRSARNGRALAETPGELRPPLPLPRAATGDRSRSGAGLLRLVCDTAALPGAGRARSTDCRASSDSDFRFRNPAGCFWRERGWRGRCRGRGLWLVGAGARRRGWRRRRGRATRARFGAG